MKPATTLRLVNGDCLAGMAALPPQSFDLCVTSPPYNLGIAYSQHDDSSDRASYLDWTRAWAAQLRRVLRDDASFFLNVGASPSNPMLPHEILLAMKDLFVLQNTIHWIKSITVQTRDGKTISTGHFKPINSQRFLTDCHEYIFHLTKSGRAPLDRLAVGVPYADKSNIKRWSHTKGTDKRCRGNNWFIPYQTIQSRDADRPHPATFPKELPQMCLRLHGRRPDLAMIEPFLGIGASALAALDEEIGAFTGFEIDPAYFKVANKNIQGWEALQETARSQPKLL